MGIYKKILTKDFILMIICVILAGTAQMAVNTNLAGYVVGEVGLSQPQLGTINSVGGIVAVVAYPLIGVLCDKIPYKFSGVMGAVIHGAAFLMYLQANSFGSVMLARCLQFAAFGFILNAALSIASCVKKEWRSAAMTLYGLGPALSYFTRPQLGTSIIQNSGYGVVFKMCAVVAFITAVVFLFIGNVKMEADPNAPKKVVFGFEKTAMPGFILGLLILQIVFIGQTYATVSLLERGIAQAAAFWTVGAVVNIVARLFLTKIINKAGINKTFYFTVALLVVAVLCIALANNIGLVMLAAVCWGIGYNGTQACVMSVSVLRATPERLGQANSTHQMGHNASQIVWSPIAGVIIGIMGYQNMFLIMILPILAGIVFYLVYVRRMVNRTMEERAAAEQE